MSEQIAMLSWWVQVLMVGLGGMLGTLSRFGVGKVVHWAHPLEANDWPMYVSASGTLVVNALGCFLFGVVWAGLIAMRPSWSGLAMLGLLTGFMGAFTTFSTFAFETHELYVRHGWLSAAGYWFLQNALGILLLMVGIWLVKLAAGGTAVLGG